MRRSTTGPKNKKINSLKKNELVQLIKKLESNNQTSSSVYAAASKQLTLR